MHLEKSEAELIAMSCSGDRDAFYCLIQPCERGVFTAAMSILNNAADAEEAGLVTFAPDEIDWDDEVRVAVEARAAFSPDAMTGLEANLRFAGPETMETKIFGRLTAWQNWIFQRPNAVGEKGALKVYGQQGRPEFDWKRT
jgi:benzoyl-CoA-dihydrodiol lyase